MMKGSWSEIFTSMPDGAFFELVRNYLGPVATPFHKPDLAQGMEQFFRRREVQDAAMALLGEDERRLLTVIGTLSEARESDLVPYFPNWTRIQLHSRLLNLSERLLTWPSSGPGRGRFSLTPLSVIAMECGYLGPGSLCGPGKTTEFAVTDETSSPDFYDDRFFTAMLSLLCERQVLILKEGGLRKKALDDLSIRLAPIFRGGTERLHRLGEALVAGDLALRDGETFLPVSETWEVWERWSGKRRRYAFLALAMFGRIPLTDGILTLAKALVEDWPEKRGFSAVDLLPLFRLFRGDPDCDADSASQALDALVALGLLSRSDDGLYGHYSSTMPSSESRGGLGYTPVGDITVEPGAAFRAILAVFGKLQSFDVTTVLHLNKDSVFRGLKAGYSLDQFVSCLEGDSGRPLPQNLRVSLAEWNREFQSVSLSSGVLLRAEGHKKHLIDGTGVLKPYSGEPLAEGLWFLPAHREKEWRAALEGIGIDFLPDLPQTSLGKSSEKVERGGLTALPYQEKDFDTSAGMSWKTPEIIPRDEDRISRLRKSLEEAHLPEEEEEVLSERIARGLILLEEQIRPGAFRFEVMSAKGLDYRGKLRLVEATLQHGDDHLEVSVARGMDIVVLRLLPTTLEKDGDDHVLVGRLLPEEEEARFRVRKIGFLRRIKASIF